MTLRVTMLGSGTSSGVPVIGCRCAVCSSDDPRNRRSRAGAKLELPGGTLLVDTPTELREQCLRFGLSRVDGVLYTHAHADHVFGLDDLRVFNFRQRRDIACYGSEATLASLRRTFWYVFEPGQEGGGKPRLELVPVSGPFAAAGATIVPVPVLHGALEVLGYRLGSFAYVTDCSRIPEASFGLLSGVEVLILGALRYHPHPTHFSIPEAVAAAERIGASRTYFTHLAHDVDHARLQVQLPPGIELGYDGLVLELD
ncbi:MAG: MBL fold metallo-hydrolase [Thermoanaerobaculia bacterium]